MSFKLSSHKKKYLLYLLFTYTGAITIVLLAFYFPQQFFFFDHTGGLLRVLFIFVFYITLLVLTVWLVIKLFAKELGVCARFYNAASINKFSDISRSIFANDSNHALIKALLIVLLIFTTLFKSIWSIVWGILKFTGTALASSGESRKDTKPKYTEILGNVFEGDFRVGKSDYTGNIKDKDGYTIGHMNDRK